MPNPRRPLSWALQFVDLLRIELTNWRWTWRLALVLGTVAPLGTILALRFLLGSTDAAALAHVMAGNLTLALIFENQMRVGTHFVFMRFHGTFEYFAALPVSRSALLAAVASAFFLLSLPALLVLGTLGPLLLGLTLRPSPLLLLVVPLCALALAGTGALVGMLARTPAEAGSLGMLTSFLLAGLGPVVIPPERLPSWLVQLGYLSPATYAASALRQVLFGPLAARLLIDLSVLGLFAVVTFWGVTRRLDWRQA